MSSVIRQEDRSNIQLERDGFKQYPRKKEIVMARQLSDAEAPLRIHTDWAGTIVATKGYMICYETGEQYHKDASHYHHWPVDPDIFSRTYRDWDETFMPTPAQKVLMEAGCKPYYKFANVWAKELETGVYIQSVEHEKPVLVPEDRVLAIGEDGEPWAMGEKTFHDRYEVSRIQKPKGLTGIVKRLVSFFSRD